MEGENKHCYGCRYYKPYYKRDMFSLIDAISGFVQKKKLRWKNTSFAKIILASIMGALIERMQRWRL